jgi:hypothetical protein
MHRGVFRPDGLSLVETTIILLILMVLTGVLAPSINDFVNDAKDVKVKEDCEAIGDATAGMGEGQRNGGWDRDVLCVSAGRDRRFETPFGGGRRRARTGAAMTSSTSSRGTRGESGELAIC